MEVAIIERPRAQLIPVELMEPKGFAKVSSLMIQSIIS